MCTQVDEALNNDAWQGLRGISSAGRAPALQAGGRRFDPVILHQVFLLKRWQTTVPGEVLWFASRY